jgi:hypothetical protein
MADVSASTIIIDSEAKFEPVDLELYQMQRKFAGNNVSVPIPDKYSSFTEMIRDQNPLPDPEFKEGDVQPIIEDVGAALDKIEKHEVEFKKLVEDMFEDSKGFQKLTQDEIELRMVERKQNGLSKMMVMTQKGNEGCVGILSAAEQAIYTSQHQNSPVYNPMSEASASVVIPTIEEANGDANGRPNEVDSWTTLVA